jgi:hypothetical protein
MIAATPLLLLFLLAIAAFIALTVFARGKQSRRAHHGPVCAACGYSAVGLTTMTCPECGSDLRAVGILAPGMDQRPHQWLARIMVFTVLLGFLAIVVTPTLFAVMPLRRSYSKQLLLTSPISRAYREVVLDTRAATWGTAPQTPLPVQIEIISNVPTTASAAPATFMPPRMLVLANGTYEYTTPGKPTVVRPKGFGAQAVLDWLSAAGVDTTHPSVPKEAARIAGEARLLARSARRAMAGSHAGGFSSRGSMGGSDDLFATISSNETSDRRPPAWTALPLTLFWFAIWFSGLRYLVRRTPTRRT